MPKKRYRDPLTLKEAPDYLGEVVLIKYTPGVKHWCRLLDTPDLPDLGRRQVVVLTGRKMKDLDDLGYCILDDPKPKFGVIFLHDPDPKELAVLRGVVGRMLKKTFKPAFFKGAFEAFMLHTYLHELGHVKHVLGNGHRGGRDFHEDKAEEYAWKQIEKLYGKELVLAAMGLYWMVGG